MKPRDVVQEVGAVEILDTNVNAELRNIDRDVIFVHISDALKENLVADRRREETTRRATETRYRRQLVHPLTCVAMDW